MLKRTLEFKQQLRPNRPLVDTCVFALRITNETEKLRVVNNYVCVLTCNATARPMTMKM